MGSTGAGEPEPGATGSPAPCSMLLLSMNDFANFKQIGKGKDCVVYSASCEKLGGTSVVLKVYDKAKISAIKHRSVRREARIMRYLTDKRIPHTTAYTGAFQDSKQIYIVMEHCKGGDLLEQLLKEGRAMPEKRVVREVVLPSLTALAHLHAAGIIHRDIKLENLFISSRGHLQLGDFGLAISVLEERAISPVGTLEYMSPEILRLPSTDLVLKGLVRVEDIAPIDEKVDVWSFGVTVYELVTGRSPFEGGSKDEIKAAILGFQMRTLPGFLTPGCQDFILKCLCPKAADRPSALALLSHPWVQLHCTPADLVTIARLPLQLPKVPMGYKQSAAASAAAAAAAAAAKAQEQQLGEQQAAAGQTTCSSAGGAAQQQSPALSPRECEAAVAVAGKPSPRFGQGPETKIHAKSSSTSSPDSPQIPAFMPSPGPCSPGCMAGSNGSVASATCSHTDTGRSSSGSRSSNSSSSAAGPAAGAAGSHLPHSIGHTVSSDSVRSHGGLSTNDSATSMYQQSLAAMAAGLVSGNACSMSKGWAGAAVAGTAAPAAGWVQEPIQESPTDESAAAAASVAGASGPSERSFTGRQQQQQQAAMQQHLQDQQRQQPAMQQAPVLSAAQRAEQDKQAALFAHITSSKVLAAQAQAAGGQEKQKKSPSGGKRLWRWCVAAVAASPNASS